MAKAQSKPRAPRTAQPPPPRVAPAPDLPLAPGWLRRAPTAWALGGMAVLVLVLLGGGLFHAGRVLGAPNTDMATQFYAWRWWGFRELAQGRFPLWNPNIYSGAPYFGGVQAGLLYPPNLIFLLLPTAVAINWSIALNLWLLGAFMFLWARGRGLLHLPAFFAGCVAMLGGTVLPHVYAGHLSNLCTMPWCPAVLWAIDRWLGHRDRRALLLGIAFFAIQNFAGHPQYMFYCSLGASLYGALRLAQLGRAWLRGGLGIAAIFIGGALLAAVQLAAAAQAGGETVRAHPLPWEFASMFAFPPENFATLVAPNFFGNLATYWGRCYLWEMSLFIGAAALILIIGALCHAPRRATWPLAATALALLVLALGRHTPLFAVLYAHAPGFNRFRGVSKFVFPASIFLALLAGYGCQLLCEQRRAPRGLLLGAGGLAALCFGLAGWVGGMGSLQWHHLLQQLAASGEMFVQPAVNCPAPQIAAFQHAALIACLVPGLVAALAAAALALQTRVGALRWALPVLGLAELITVGHGNVATFAEQSIRPAATADFFATHPGDYRVLNADWSNNQLLYPNGDIWGNDPNLTLRYAEFFAMTQGQDPGSATQNVQLRQLDPLFRLVRLGYYLTPEMATFQPAPTPPLPHVALLRGYRVLAGRDAIFSALREPEFDPAAIALLEHEPGIDMTGGSAPAPQEYARVVTETSDKLTVEANLLRPALLLVTDLYTPGWRVRALPGSSQQAYTLMPADYILRAVPLQRGHHLLQMYYRPRAVIAGMYISLLALLGYAAAWLMVVRRRRGSTPAAR